MRVNIRERLLLLTVAPFMLLLFTILSVSYVHAVTDAAEQQLIRADSVVEAAQALRSNLDDVQTGARVYGLSGSPRYEKLYTTALKKTAKSQTKLLNLIRKDPGELTRFYRLARLTQVRLDLFAGDVQERHAGEAIQIGKSYVSDRRITLLEAWRASFDDFLAAEDELKADRRSALLANSTILSYVLVIAAIFGFLITIALTISAGHRIVGRLHELNANATRAAAGESIGESLSGGDEIADVDNHIRMLLTRLAERERRLSLYQLLAERTREIMFFVSDDRIFEANDSAFAAYGFSRDEFIGSSVWALHPLDDHAGLHARLASVGPGESTVFETQHWRKDGSVIPVEVTASGTEFEGRRLHLCIVRDVSERRRSDASLKAALDRANEASRFKSEFVATMSHEIRTPMNAILGMTELLLGTPLDDEQFEFTSAVRTSSESLMRIINDVLDFSKIEAGKLEIESTEFDLAACVESVAEILALQARRKGIVLTCFVDPRIGALVRGDAVRIRQVLLNLAGNALKFTQRGEIALSASLTGDDGTAMEIRFTVQDTGIGIAPDVQNRLFQAFTQADGSTTRRYGGTGLGLAISRRLVELMGGTIGVTSTVGSGSTFWFSLRLPLGTKPPADYDHPVQGMRALVADPEPASRSALVRYLRAWGLETAESTRLEDAEERFDVAFIDCTLLGERCFTFPGELGPHHPLAGVPLVLTAGVDVPQRARAARDAGYAAYLVKPFRQSLIFDALARFAEDRRSASAALPDASATLPTAPTRTATLRPTIQATAAVRNSARILLVEDNLVNQRLACKQLEKLGFTATVADNGRIALEAVRLQEFDLILMDCHMPEMDGFAATRAIRKLQTTNGRRVPIVAMTADARPEDRAACLSADMDDYLAKPVGLAALEAKVARWLPTDQASATVAES